MSLKKLLETVNMKEIEILIGNYEKWKCIAVHFILFPPSQVQRQYSTGELPLYDR